MARAHPAELRAAAIAHAVAHGVTAAARQYDVFPSTVTRWMKAAGVATVHPERTRAATTAAQATNALKWAEYRSTAVDELAGITKKTIVKIHDALDNGKARNASDLTRVLCGAIDKAQLLSGGSTSRLDVEGEREQTVEDARVRALRLVGGAG